MRQIRALMLGWEFPPYISGGLGTACYGLTRAMDRFGAQVTFLLPWGRPIRITGTGEAFTAQNIQEQLPEGFENVKFRRIPSALKPYGVITWEGENPSSSRQTANRKQKSLSNGKDFEDSGRGGNYGPNIYTLVQDYAKKAAKIAKDEDFEIIHAHDWMTYPAGIKVARQSGKPLIVQVHSTEFDRSGEHVNQMVYDIEREGMHLADKVIAVSNYTRNIIIDRYGISPEKVEVVYNGVDYNNGPEDVSVQSLPSKNDKVVLFLGRVTMQKGPEHFLQAARKVSERIDNVKFIMAGDGDMLYQCIELAARLGIGHKVFFTKFLRGDDVCKAYKMADLYVMPSVSEPFGIAPLEALHNNVPVLISKQSGIAETLRNALKTDFWDINEMANKMAAVLRRPALQQMLTEEGRKEAYKFSWDDTAARIYQIYEREVGIRVSSQV